MPTYNEEGCIEQVIESWIGTVNTFPGSEILVLNDGSKDKTKYKLDKLKKRYSSLKVIHKKNEGHGKTIELGYREAIKTKHAWVFQVDSDNQFLPRDFKKIWAKRNRSNFILGYRKKRNDPLHRLLLASMTRLCIFILFSKYLEDANIPFRLIKRTYLKDLLEIVPAGVFAPNIFHAILAARDNHDLVHIPVVHLKRKTDGSSLKRLNLIKVSFRSFKELIEFRLNPGKNFQ